VARYKSPKHRVITPAKIVKKLRITHAKIPKLRAKYEKKQGGICPICERPLARLQTTLDHCHKTGYVRGTLCKNCNGIEGKLANLLARLDVGKIGADKIIEDLANWRNPTNLKLKYIHPNAETLAEQKERQKLRQRKLYHERKRKAIKGK
jgi:hypothetical protein